jgi:hypothetical protein
MFFLFFGKNMNRNKTQTTELKKQYYCLKFKNCFATISANDASNSSKWSNKKKTENTNSLFDYIIGLNL